MILFATDWLAEMYDPHPDKFGRWFESHFHRILDDTNVTIVKWVIGVFIILIGVSIVTPIVTNVEDWNAIWAIIWE